MKRFAVFIAGLAALLVSCQSISNVPMPVTAQMATRARTTQHVDLVALQQGRTLFVSRCIECHTLPAVSQHTAAEWPRLIDEMADRASLKPAERKAVLAYILAVREL